MPEIEPTQAPRPPRREPAFTPKQIEKILNFAADNPDSDSSQRFKKILGIDNLALGAWKEAKLNPENEKAIKVRNKIYDIISDKFKAIQKTSVLSPGRVGFIDRFVVKNFLAGEPQEQAKYFQRKDYKTRINQETGKVEVRKPNEAIFSVIDPDGIDIFDFFDVSSDILEGIVTGIAGTMGLPGGVPGALAAGSAGAAGFESAKQFAGQALGIRDELNPERVKEAAAFGLAGTGAAKLAGKGFEMLGRGASKFLKTLPGTGKLKPDADNIQAAADRLKLDPTPGQLVDSLALQELEEVARNQRQLFMTSSLRNQILRNQKILEAVAEDILKFNPSFSRTKEISEAGEEMAKAVAERLKPAEEIYGALEAPFQRLPILNTKAIVDKIAQLYKGTPGDKATRNMLDDLLDEVVQIDTLADLSTFKKNIGKMLDKNSSDNKKEAIKRLYGSIIESRNQSIVDAYKYIGKEEMGADIARKLAQADKIYKTVIEDISGAIAPLGKKIKVPPKQAVEEFFKNHEPSKTIYAFLKLKDPRQIQHVKNTFPAAFEKMRNLAIEDIFQKVKQGSVVSPKSLITHLEKMEPETKKLLFGNNATQKIKDMDTWLSSLPDIKKVGNVSRSAWTIMGAAGRFSLLSKVPILNQIIDEFSASEQALRRAWIANPLGAARSFLKAGEAVSGKLGVGAATFGIRKGAENRQQPPTFINLAPEFGGIK